MEKSNQSVDNLLGKLSYESIDSQLVTDMLKIMDLALHQRVKVQNKLLKQSEHAEIFRILQNNEEIKEFMKNLS